MWSQKILPLLSLPERGKVWAGAEQHKCFPDLLQSQGAEWQAQPAVTRCDRGATIPHYVCYHHASQHSRVPGNTQHSAFRQSGDNLSSNIVLWSVVIMHSSENSLEICKAGAKEESWAPQPRPELPAVPARPVSQRAAQPRAQLAGFLLQTETLFCYYSSTKDVTFHSVFCISVELSKNARICCCKAFSPLFQKAQSLRFVTENVQQQPPQETLQKTPTVLFLLVESQWFVHWREGLGFTTKI